MWSTGTARKLVMTVFLIGVFLILATASLCENARAAETIWEGSGTINFGGFTARDFEAEFGDSITVEFNSSRFVDLFFVEDEGFQDYQIMQQQGSGEFLYYIDGSRLNTMSYEHTFLAPESGTFYYIIDNTDMPDDGVDPIGNVSYTISLTKDELGFDMGLFAMICGAIAGIVVFIVIIIIYFYVVRKKREETTTTMDYEHSPIYYQKTDTGPITCPSCGNLSTGGTYCNICGRRLR